MRPLTFISTHAWVRKRRLEAASTQEAAHWRNCEIALEAYCEGITPPGKTHRRWGVPLCVDKVEV